MTPPERDKDKSAMRRRVWYTPAHPQVVHGQLDFGESTVAPAGKGVVDAAAPPPNLVKACIEKINCVASMTFDEIHKQNDVGFLELLDMSLTLIAALSGDQGPYCARQQNGKIEINEGDASTRKDEGCIGTTGLATTANAVSASPDWLPHNGVECPVPGDTMVDIDMLKGQLYNLIAAELDWAHVKYYRIVKPGGGV